MQLKGVIALSICSRGESVLAVCLFPRSNKMDLTSFFRVAESLKNLYESSVRLPKRRRNDESNRVERSSVVQMYYVDKSNDFCEADRRAGSAGTAGR